MEKFKELHNKIEKNLNLVTEEEAYIAISLMNQYLEEKISEKTKSDIKITEAFKLWQTLHSIDDEEEKKTILYKLYKASNDVTEEEKEKWAIKMTKEYGGK